MSLQVYECPDHEVFEVLQRALEVPFTVPCPKCGQTSTHVFAPPAVIEVKRDWNEQANLYQRDPYTQAKAQLTNMTNESRERQDRWDTPPTKITEEAVQTAARQIDAEQRTRGTRPTPQQKQVAHARKIEKTKPKD